MYGSDTEFGVDYGEPSHHDSSGMPDYQGDLAFLLIPAAIGFGYLLAIFQGWEAISKGVIGCIGCVVYLIFSTCIGKYDGTLQDILALLCIGGAIYLFHKRRKAKG